jgi:hypothetical protein
MPLVFLGQFHQLGVFASPQQRSAVKLDLRLSDEFPAGCVS